jgi:hypothetical protein
MLIPVKAVHSAALALQEQGDITQTMFEDAYHCRFGLSTDNENYWLHFDRREYASAFILRWM